MYLCWPSPLNVAVQQGLVHCEDNYEAVLSQWNIAQSIDTQQSTLTCQFWYIWSWLWVVLRCLMFCEDGPFIFFIVSLSLSLFFCPHRQKNAFTLLWNKTSEGEKKGEGGRREGEWRETMKFNPFKTVSFSDHTSGRWVFIGGTGEAEITGLVIVSSKSAELWGTPSAVFHQTENERVKGQYEEKQKCFSPSCWFLSLHLTSE